MAKFTLTTWISQF